MQINLTSNISLNQNLAFTHIDDDLVVMGPKDGHFYGVNSVGAQIWSLLEVQTMSLQDICNSIQENYDVTESQCLEDVIHFINAMVNQDMVMITG